MSKWRVEVIEHARYESTVEVEANDWSSARDAAFAKVQESPHALGSVWFDTRPQGVIQLGEPWAKSYGWYMDGGVPSDIIVAQRSCGNAFTAEDVLILRARIEALGFGVVDSWNGAGTDTVSFRCTGRKGFTDLTAKQIAALVAPRPAP